VSWFLRPVVAVLFAMAIIGLVRPLLQDIRRQGGPARMLTSFHAPVFHASQLFTIFIIAVVATMVSVALQWDFSAKIVPLVVGIIALSMAGLSLFNDMCRRPTAVNEEGLAEHAQHDVGARIHMDLTSDTAHLPVATIAARAAWFFGYLIAFMAVMAVIGLIPTVAIFVVFFMRFEGRERWSLVIPYVVILVLGIYIAFDMFMAVPWPPTLLGTWFPALKVIPSV
jgi:putative tricarboxylic transport membrane protein